jgi:H+/gluconate symporter-like permease
LRASVTARATLVDFWRRVSRAALTGSASGALTIVLDALGETYMRLAAEQGIDPALLHRVAVIGSSTLDSLPHNSVVVTLLAVCGVTHGKSYLVLMVASARFWRSSW